MCVKTVTARWRPPRPAAVPPARRARARRRSTPCRAAGSRWRYRRRSRRGGALPGRLPSRQPDEREPDADPRHVAQPANDGGIDAQHGIEAQELKEEVQRALLRADFEGHEEDRVLNQRGEPADGIRLKVGHVQAHAETDQYILEHEDRATEILEEERLKKSPRSPVIELRDLHV